MPDPKLPYISLPSAARQMGMHPDTLKSWVREGRVVGYTVGDKSNPRSLRWFVDRDSLDLLFETHRVGPTLFSDPVAKRAEEGDHRDT